MPSPTRLQSNKTIKASRHCITVAEVWRNDVPLPPHGTHGYGRNVHDLAPVNVWTVTVTVSPA